jgi:hypothetical protein
MTTSKYLKVGMIALAGACIGAASAQSSGPLGISARIGGFYPSSDSARNLSSTWYSFGLDFKLSTLPSLGTGFHSYIGLSGDYIGNGGDNIIPVALTYNIRQGQMVYSAGLGPEFRNDGDLESSSVGLGEQVGVAYEFGNMPTPIFIQAKYFFGSSQLNGLGVFLGVRF